MIYDCFLFMSELDLLKIRCEELKELEVTHILVEATRTFTGKSKPLTYYQNREHFKEYNIQHFVSNTLLENVSPWENETNQRNYILDALLMCGAKDEDWVIVSDVDEIVRKESVEKYKPEMGLTAFKMDVFWYKINYLAERQTWVVPRIMTYEYLKNSTPDRIRRSGYENIIDFAGHHYSYIGDEDFIINKINSFSHQELNIEPNTNREHLKDCIDTGKSIWGKSKFKVIDIDETYPVSVQNNLEFLYKHIAKKNEITN